MGKHTFGPRSILIVVLSMLLTVALAACGDSPTATSAPKPTAPAATTAAATTAAATTVAATTVATTAAATTVAATTAAPTTVAATTAATTAAGLPAPAGLKEIVLGKEIEDLYAKQYASLGITKYDLTVYATDETKEKTAELAALNATGSGYTFAGPAGQTKPFLYNGSLLGFYTKSGSDDLFFSASDAASAIQNLKDGGVSDATIQKIADQLKGKQSTVALVSGKDLVKPLGAAYAQAGSGATPAATSAPLVNGITQVEVSPEVAALFTKSLAGGANANVQVYVSDVDADKLAADVDANVVGTGYKFAAPGQNKPFSVSGTVVGYYTKSGSPDIVFALTPVTADFEKSLPSSGAAPAGLQKFVDAVKGKKNLLTVFSGTNLVQNIFAAVSGGTTTAAATTAAGASSGAGAKATIPSDLTLTGDAVLTLLDKLTTSSNNYKSVKLNMKGKTITAGQSTDLTLSAVVIKPDKVSFDISAAGQKIGFVLIGTDTYLNVGGAWQKVTDEATKAQFAQTLTSINQSTIDKNELKKYAGSTVTVLPDEKVGGVDVGVLEFDTTNAQDPTIKQLGKVTYKFDSQFRVVESIIKSPQAEFDILLTDYDSPSNKIDAPIP